MDLCRKVVDIGSIVDVNTSRRNTCDDRQLAGRLVQAPRLVVLDHGMQSDGDGDET